MAEIVSDVPSTHRPRFKYPWDEWLDGQTRRLVPGQDFSESVSPHSFIAGARVVAKRRGVGIEGKVREGGVVFLTAHHPQAVDESL